MAGRLEKYKEDDVILREGKHNDKMFLILEGSVVLYMNYGKENEYVVGIRGKNKLFGEMSMLAEEPSMYTVVAFSETSVVWFQKNNLNMFLNSYPGCVVDFMTNIAKNNSYMRKSFAMLVDEVNAVNDKLIDRENVYKDTVKMSALSFEEKNSNGYRYVNN